jgi:hypothetical protein
MKQWRFRCVSCGNEQSHESVKARNASASGTERWIYFSCEGRITPGIGCDWTLGGLFQIHTLEVEDDKRATPCFRFAHDLGDEELQKVVLP